MSAQRKYYLAAATFLTIGAILAVIKTQTVALIVFVVLAAMMVWISFRVDRIVENRRPSDRPGARDRD